MHSAPITLDPIGYIKTEVAEADIPHKRAEIIAELVLFEHLTAALDGIEEYSHLFVLFWMHKVTPQAFCAKVHPRGREELPLTGVLATRGRSRPNPIGLAVVELLERDANRLKVRRLDALNGTPILDIKPYDPYDVFTDIRTPQWWSQLRR
jgi:tRNA-Thr(GGU) m(6)t(6)A37 methyltransferase TsaA